jgi:hypothetical protein
MARRTRIIARAFFISLPFTLKRNFHRSKASPLFLLVRYTINPGFDTGKSKVILAIMHGGLLTNTYKFITQSSAFRWVADTLPHATSSPAALPKGALRVESIHQINSLRATEVGIEIPPSDAASSGRKQASKTRWLLALLYLHFSQARVGQYLRPTLAIGWTFRQTASAVKSNQPKRIQLSTA